MINSQKFSNYYFQQLINAIKDIDSNEKRPIEIEKDIPGKNYNPILLNILLGLLILLILIKNLRV